MQLARLVLSVHILMGLVLVVPHYQMDLFDPCGMHIVVSLEVASGILVLGRSNSDWSVVC